MKLQNISSIVTGGGRGIGRSISLKIASEGADVAIIAEKDLKSADETAEQVRQLGRKAIVLKADVSNPDIVTEMVSKVLETFGKIDLLINNAAISLRGPLEQLSVENWDRVFAVNLKGIFLCGVAVAREMIKQSKGCIINIAAASGHRSYGGGGGRWTEQGRCDQSNKANGCGVGEIQYPRQRGGSRTDYDP